MESFVLRCSNCCLTCVLFYPVVPSVDGRRDGYRSPPRNYSAARVQRHTGRENRKEDNHPDVSMHVHSGDRKEHMWCTKQRSPLSPSSVLSIETRSRRLFFFFLLFPLKFSTNILQLDSTFTLKFQARQARSTDNFSVLPTTHIAQLVSNYLVHLLT